MERTLKVSMVKSVIGRPEKQREVLRGLGLRRMHRTVYLKDNPENRGMIQKVIHLVSVEEVEGTVA